MFRGDRWILLLGISLFLVAGSWSLLERAPAAFGAEPARKGARPERAANVTAEKDNLTAEKDDPFLSVVDERGDPIPKFKVNVWAHGLERPSDYSGSDGRISPNQLLSATRNAPGVFLTVRADGYASTLHQFFGPELKKLKAGEAILVMHPGEEVEISFRLPEGMTWPKGVQPELYFFALEDSIRGMSKAGVQAQGALADANLLNARFDQPGVATVRLSAATAPICVAIHAPGFLRFFEHGPFNLARIKNGKLEIAIEKPAALDVQFDLGDTSALPFTGATISLQWKNPATHRFLDVASGDGPKPKQELKLTELPPGEYLATVHAHAKPGATSPLVYTATKSFHLAAGQSERIEIPFTPPDPNAFRGDRTAILHLLKPDGSPLTGEKVTISYHDEHYVLPVFSGTIPASGTVTLEGITDRKPEGTHRDPYSVTVAGRRLGVFGFATSSPTAEFTFRVPAVVGDVAPDVPLTNVAGGAPAKLSDFRGKVVLVEFWATWCGPCQEPMGKMNQLVVDKPEVWKDQAVIVPISIDNATDVVTAHVKARGWTNLQYYWSGNDGAGGWQSPAPQAFGVNGVPTSFILDRKGKIIWTGHPADTTGGKDLEARIEEAIAH
jgi:thiol-disulfide isomerase/thioredoxin